MILDDNLISLIGTLGFPIVMVLWFMIRTEKIIKHNTDAFNRLAVVLSSRR